MPPQRGIYSQDNSIVRRCVPQNKSQTFLISSDYYDQILRLDPVNSQEEFEIRFMRFYLWSEQASLGFLCHDFANSLTDHRYSKESQQSSRSALLCPGSFDAAYANYLSEAYKPSSYSSWIASFEASHLSKIVISKIHNQDLKFSVLLPVFNTEPAYLRACVESVLLKSIIIGSCVLSMIAAPVKIRLQSYNSLETLIAELKSSFGVKMAIS